MAPKSKKNSKTGLIAGVGIGFMTLVCFIALATAIILYSVLKPKAPEATQASFTVYATPSQDGGANLQLSPFFNYDNPLSDKVSVTMSLSSDSRINTKLFPGKITTVHDTMFDTATIEDGNKWRCDLVSAIQLESNGVATDIQMTFACIRQ